jgi:hypothetical protein
MNDNMNTGGRDSWGGLPPLDERPGPAKRISSAEAARMVQAALHTQAISSRSTARRFAVAAMLALALGGAASAGYVVTRWRATAPIIEPLSSPLAPRAEAPSLAPRTRLERAARPETRPRLRAEPDDLLQIANDLRARSRWRDAERAYRRVAERAPGSEGAYAANVAVASLLLDQLHDPRGALRLYRQTLSARPQGALAEEARWGMAEAYRRTGNRQAEEAALRTFLAAHPHSLMKARAQSRLEDLSSGNR